MQNNIVNQFKEGEFWNRLTSNTSKTMVECTENGWEIKIQESRMQDNLNEIRKEQTVEDDEAYMDCSGAKSNEFEAGFQPKLKLAFG